MPGWTLLIAPVVLAIGCGSSSSPNGGPADLAPSPSTDLAAVASRDLPAPASGGDLSAPTGSDLAATASDLAHPPSFQKDVLPILMGSGCLSHHMTTAWNGVEGLSGATAMIAYLTSTAAGQCAGDKLVTSGDAANSYLYQKVSGSFAAPCAVSDTMPPGAGPLPAAQSDAIKAWINAGAPNN